MDPLSGLPMVGAQQEQQVSLQDETARAHMAGTLELYLSYKTREEVQSQ